MKSKQSGLFYGLSENQIMMTCMIFLSQLKDDEFEGYPGITYENGKKHLEYRLGSVGFFAG